MRKCMNCVECKEYIYAKGAYYCADSGENLTEEELHDVENDCEMYSER